jgi:hypothetical protein
LASAKIGTDVSSSARARTMPAYFGFDVLFQAYSTDAGIPTCFAARTIVAPCLRNFAVNSSALACIASVYRGRSRRPDTLAHSTSLRNTSISFFMSTSVSTKVSRPEPYIHLQHSPF